MKERKQRDDDKRQTAFHEAGHFIIAEHFGVGVRCHLVDRGTPTDWETSFTGQTTYRRSTAFRHAVIGWAGVLGQEMHAKEHDEWFNEVDFIWEYFEVGPEDMSETDLQAVNGHPMKRRAFDTAVRILSRNFQQVQIVAANLIKKGVHP